MRLVTRSDFDGIACAVLLGYLGLIDEFKFVHPKDVQDGLIEVNQNDILANIPYVKGCGLWFDHHSSELERGSLAQDFQGTCLPAPSTAQNIFDYYGGLKKFNSELEKLVKLVNKSDSACFNIQEVLHPGSDILICFLVDPRTGLGRYKDYRISNFELMVKLVDLLQKHGVAEILQDPDVKERMDRYYEQQEEYKATIRKYSRVEGNALILDLRGAPEFPVGNRFVEYALFPEQNISIRLLDGREKKNCVLAVGHSIINGSSIVDVGSLMLKYGGGGHHKAGTCQVSYQDADSILQEILTVINQG